MKITTESWDKLIENAKPDYETVLVPAFEEKEEPNEIEKKNEAMLAKIVDILKLKSSERAISDLNEVMPFFQNLKIF